MEQASFLSRLFRFVFLRLPAHIAGNRMRVNALYANVKCMKMSALHVLDYNKTRESVCAKSFFFLSLYIVKKKTIHHVQYIINSYAFSFRSMSPFRLVD